MTAYKIADGFNNLGGLTDVSVQPASQGIVYPRQIKGGDLSSSPDGFAQDEWVYNKIIDSTYQTLLAEFGLDSVESKEVTIRTQDRNKTGWVRKNAIIHRPFVPRDGSFRMGFWNSVKFRFTFVHPIEADFGSADFDSADFLISV